MNTLKKTLEQREQPELIAIIQHMLRQERQVIAGWVQDALKQKATWSSSERYEILLAALERTN